MRKAADDRNSSSIGKRWIIRKLRNHHATHHAPELMQSWNFNITFPIFDAIYGTRYRGE